MTIKDIAELSGYGIGTVSRVLNNQAGVSEKAKEKILQVMAESDYEPNENARHLKRRNGSTICVVVKGNNNFLFADIIERIQSQLEKIEEDINVTYIDEDGDEVEYALKLIRDRSPKGIIFLGANASYFNERLDNVDVPCIILTTSAEGITHGNISSVAINDVEAACEMITYLIRKGHREIGVIGGNLKEKQVGFSRFSGCIRGFELNNVTFNQKRNYMPCRYSMEEGYEATVKLINSNPDITAIFAFSDTLAIGAMRAIMDLGKRIPEDISVAGFDGILLAKYSIPRLTTIYQDTKVIALRGVELALKHVHYKIDGEREDAPFRLVEGDSVKDIN